MKNNKKTILFSILLVVAVCAVFLILNRDETVDYRSKYEGYDLGSVEQVEGKDRSYSNYLSEYEGADYGGQNIDIDLFQYEQTGDVQTLTNYENEQKVIYTGEESTVTWNVNLENAGLYNIYIEYFAANSRGVDVERRIRINGEVPFSGADTLTFTRLWTDGGAVRKDNQGNDIRPSQVEAFAWQNTYCEDSLGYIIDPYAFYLEKGNNTITLEGIAEPMAIRKITLIGIPEEATYDTYVQNQPKVQVSSFDETYKQVIQGEASTQRSDPSLYARYDRSSPNTQPSSITKTILNYIGGETWKKPGQWIEWEVEVPEDNYYNITIKGRQNYERGNIACRSLYIDGKIPFKEVSVIEFAYNNKWDLVTLSDEQGQPYNFYLTAGKHTLRLEVSLGNAGEILDRLQESLYTLNTMYRKIIVLTGTSPDQYRDYNIASVYPDLIDAMSLESKRLYKIVDDYVALTGQKADKIATAQLLATQLEKFSKNPDKITKQLTTFKDNVTSLGTSILNISESKLDIDYIAISGINCKVTDKKETFAKQTWHEIKSFVASFFIDYNAVGDVYAESNKDDGVVKVWIVTGRDQSTILKTMVDESFVPETGIKVNVELIDGGALLNATVAGRGPNVVLSIDSLQPVNYALRHANEDLTQFDDFESVMGNFYESAYRAFEYEGGVYAIPETQSFDVLFYRKDILEELELEIPQTWDDLIAMLPTIQSNNMTIALPTPVSNSNGSDLSMLYSLIYQNGGQIYDPSGMRTVIDEVESVRAFELYTKLFNDYGLPTVYDFVSRFRSGEMPIGIVDYSTYNTLVVSAPEIRGLWGFTLIPGTERTDSEGNTYIDRSVHSAGNCTMMIKTEDETIRKNAWEFMKWWTKTETQVRFGRELESVLGSSARYATANKVAFTQLSWSSDLVKVLDEARKSTVGFREIAGGYYTARHITNACRKVINSKEDPREVLLDYTKTINEEITKKRKEFGLPVIQE